jgi:hypothetical protein
VFVAFVLHCGVVRLINSGCFVRWSKLPRLSDQIEEFVFGAHGTVYARTESGSVYRCSSWKNECWVQSKIPQDTSRLVNTIAPCDFAAPEFYWTTNPPANPVICIQGEEIHADCFGEDTYVLDENGDAWEWSNSVCANTGTLLMLCTSVAIGAGIGLVTGIAWNHRLGQSEENEASPMLYGTD